jgi:hypothetical protein
MVDQQLLNLKIVNAKYITVASYAAITAPAATTTTPAAAPATGGYNRMNGIRGYNMGHGGAAPTMPAMAGYSTMRGYNAMGWSI